MSACRGGDFKPVHFVVICHNAAGCRLKSTRCFAFKKYFRQTLESDSQEEVMMTRVRAALIGSTRTERLQ